MGVQTLAVNPGGIGWIAAGLAAFAGLCYALAVDFYAQTSLGLIDGRVRRTGFLGRSATARQDGIARVTESTATYTLWGGIPSRWLFFLDPEGRTLLRAYAEYYSPEELDRFRAALGVPWEQLAGLRTFRQLRRELPGSVPWAMAHYWLSAILACLGAFFVAVAVIGVLDSVR